MPVSHDAVVHCYRFLLGREPENAEVIAINARAANWQDLR
jgi:hypothetical protein